MPGNREPSIDEDVLNRCEDVLEYQFKNRSLLANCLTHASIAIHRLDSNERLEFLGDAILGAVVCEMLYRQFPEDPEGEMTRIKSAVVSRNTCAKVSRELGFQDFLLLGRGLSIHETVPMSVMAAVLESIIAGVYLDGGWEPASKLIGRIMGPEIDMAAQAHNGRNFKSLLQQLTQKQIGATPVYKLLDEKGPDHSKCFKVAALVDSKKFPSAWGQTKKEAEQRAAHNALHEMEGKEIPYAVD